jgi:SUKH-4 immunity protein
MKHPNWPVYELVAVTAPLDAGLAVSSLCVPRSFFARYRADDHLSPLATSDRPNLLRFGRSSLSLLMCLDATTGEVVNILVDKNDQVIKRKPSGMDFVNSSLEQFNRSIAALIELFPYDDGQTTDNIDQQYEDWDWDAAAKKLAKVLGDIDERTSSEVDGYWVEFYCDVGMGDFATYAVLSGR